MTRAAETNATDHQPRTALVTGAARGIGFAISRRLGRDGHRVVLTDIDNEHLSEARAELRAEGVNCESVTADVRDEIQVRDLVDSIGEVDVLVNNAGIAGPAKPIWDYALEEWRAVFAVNLEAVFLICRAVLPGMVARDFGRVVNVASISGKEGNPNMAAYSTSKGGVIALTKAVAKEVAGANVMVNAVTPAVIDTDILKQLTTDAVDYMVSRIPMGRTGQPEEVAALVSWLASDECSFSTGAVFDISGGRATY